MTARILVVCQGNICRSPYAERVLRHHLSAHDVDVSSAGSGPLVDHPVEPNAAALLQQRGVDPSDHRARRLTRELIDESDLVLAVDREHRTAVVQLLPRAVRKTFTVLEAARLVELVDRTELGGSPAERVQRLPALLVGVRRQHPSGPEHDDVPDPYRRGPAAFASMADLLDPALDRLLTDLGGYAP